MSETPETYGIVDEDGLEMLDRVEQFEIDYGRLKQRIHGLRGDHIRTHNVTPNRIFMQRYHYYLLALGPDFAMNPEPEIFGMKISTINDIDDIMYVGYVEEG